MLLMALAVRPHLGYLQEAGKQEKLAVPHRKSTHSPHKHELALGSFLVLFSLVQLSLVFHLAIKTEKKPSPT